MRVRVLLAVAAVALTVAVPAAASSPAPQPGSPERSSHLGAGKQRQLAHRLMSTGGTTRTETVTRTLLAGGKSTDVDKRTVKVTVGSLDGLRDRQGVQVTWSGARPTAGIATDPNSAAAQRQEYPMMLMECRGVDSSKAPKRKRLTPESCWTQTSGERFAADYNTPLPPWRLDRYATSADRQTFVDRPQGLKGLCSARALAERWVPFVDVKGKSFGMGPDGCGGTVPEALPYTSNLVLPGNTTYAATAENGRGATVFNFRASASNASLGCSQKVACALVVIPIMGVSCDADASGLPADQIPSQTALDKAAQGCTSEGNYQPGQLYDPNQPTSSTVTANYWWSASNWRNRIVFPLSFAPSTASCDITRGGGVQAFGSELMIQASEQWAPVFCLDPSRVPVLHVQTGEPQARNLLKAGTIEAAMGSRAQDGGYGRPVVHAPIAATGFAIGFQVDSASGRPLQRLNLNARLLAKLLTQSYPAIQDIKTGYAELSSNPLNITDDPEFQALNPDAPQDLATPTASTLLSLSSDSDVIFALTSYINADPEARAWLDGKPDPWGMVVNPNYKGIALPLNGWPSLDTYMPMGLYQPGKNDCLAQNPVPYLPLVSAPLTRLSLTAVAEQFAIAQSQIVCQLVSPIPGVLDGAKLVPLGRQVPGNRFMLAVTSIPDSVRYAIPMASLQTQAPSASSAVFTSSKGRTFVLPTEQSMKAAAALMKPDRATTNWNLDYTRFHGDAAAASAYPGTLLVYIDVPTSGLSDADGEAYAAWMRYVATTGQKQGDKVGELPAGYVPLTEQDGLGALSAYTLRAADAVAQQNGAVPPLNAPTVSGKPPKPGSNGGGTGSGGPYGTGSVGPSSTPSGGGAGPGTPPGDPSSTPVAASLGKTGLLGAGSAGLILPGVLLLAMVAGLVASAVLFRSKMRSNE